MVDESSPLLLNVTLASRATTWAPKLKIYANSANPCYAIYPATPIPVAPIVTVILSTSSGISPNTKFALIGTKVD